MNSIKSRFERFAAFVFSSASSFDRGADLWDTLSHYEFYLTQHDEPNETFFEKLEELGCSRRWLLYATGEMFADNEPGQVLRYKFIHGIELANKTFSFAVKSIAPQIQASQALIDEDVESGKKVEKEVLKDAPLKNVPLKKRVVKNSGKKKQKAE